MLFRSMDLFILFPSHDKRRKNDPNVVTEYDGFVQISDSDESSHVSFNNSIASERSALLDDSFSSLGSHEEIHEIEGVTNVTPLHFSDDISNASFDNSIPSERSALLDTTFSSLGSHDLIKDTEVVTTDTYVTPSQMSDDIISQGSFRNSIPSERSLLLDGTFSSLGSDDLHFSSDRESDVTEIRNKNPVSFCSP